VNIYSGFVVFNIIWWTVLFAVLPLGVRRNETPGRGHDHGAPAEPRVLFHLGLTTAISVVLFIGAYFLINSDLITFSQG